MKKFKKLFGLMSEDNFGPEPIVINLEDGLWTIETYSSFEESSNDGLFAYGEGETLDEAISNFEKSLENTLMDN